MTLTKDNFVVTRQNNEDVAIIHVNIEGVYNFQNVIDTIREILQNQEIVERLKEKKNKICHCACHYTFDKVLACAHCPCTIFEEILKGETKQ